VFSLTRFACHQFPPSPAANGQATARALASVYNAAERAANGEENENTLGLTADTLEELMAPAKPARLTGW